MDFLCDSLTPEWPFGSASLQVGSSARVTGIPKTIVRANRGADRRQINHLTAEVC